MQHNNQQKEVFHPYYNAVSMGDTNVWYLNEIEIKKDKRGGTTGVYRNAALLSIPPGKIM